MVTIYYLQLSILNWKLLLNTILQKLSWRLIYLTLYYKNRSRDRYVFTIEEDTNYLSGEYVVITVILDWFEILHFLVDAVFYYPIAIQSDWVDETETRIT